MKRFLLVCVCLGLLVSPGFGQTVNELKGYITDLTVVPRPTGSETCQKACDYIRTKIPKEYTVELQDFTVGKRPAKNIIAYLPAANSEIIVLSAHYDSVATTPGADDNASGVAGVLALAQLHKGQNRHTISLQFYSGEEQGLIGSEYYVEHPLLPKDQPDIKKHIVVVNLDMIGRLKNKTNQLQEVVPDVYSLLDPLFQKYPFAKRVTIKGLSTSSDQESFARKGIPALFIHTGLHRDYHRPTDSADRIEYEGMVEICKYVNDLINAIDKSDIPDYHF